MSLVTTPVTIYHPAASFRRGLAEELVEHGMDVAPTPPLIDSSSHGITVLFVGGDDDWAVLADIAANEETTLVALVSHLTGLEYARALAAGADGVAHVDSEPSLIRAIIEHACAGEVVLPAAAAHDISRRVEDVLGERRSELSDAEIALLGYIAKGNSLVEFARDTFVSERTARRTLQNSCIKLGVPNRAGAIAKASRMGLI